jgi:hypothetical protein
VRRGFRAQARAVERGPPVALLAPMQRTLGSRRPWIRYSLATAADLVESVRAVDDTAVLVVPCLMQLGDGAGVDVEIRFADGTQAASLEGTVRWCHHAPLVARVPYLAGVTLNPICAEEVARVAGSAAASGKHSASRGPRSHPRSPASLLVSITAGNVAIPGRIEDLSPAGARVAADLPRPLREGEEVTVEFLDARLRMRTHPFRAIVRWCDPVGRFGLSFVQLDPATEEAVAREVAHAIGTSRRTGTR